MIGEKWSGVPNCEHRATCSKCGTIESMEHILLECRYDARSLIWRKAEDIWPHGQQRWPRITLGTILGIGSIALTEEHPIDNRLNTRSVKTKGQTRLLQILISEASHLIWVIRCERVIHDREHTAQEIGMRWKQKINEKLTTDRITATKIKRDKQTTTLTNATWEEALKKQNITHKNWLNRQEVF